MLDQIKRAHQVECVVSQGDCGAIGADEVPSAPASGEAQRLFRKIEAGGEKFFLLAFEEKSCSAADIEQARARPVKPGRIAIDEPGRQREPALEPPMVILEPKHSLIFAWFHL
jgi:hypothetical protein